MNKLTQLLDKLENDCTLIDGDSGEEYLDIPMENWKELRAVIDKNIQEN